MNVDLRILRADVRKHLQVEVDAQFGWWPPEGAPAHLLGREFIELLVNLLNTENIMILVPFGAIEGAELAIDVADVCVVDVAINNVGDNLRAATIVGAVLAAERRKSASAPSSCNGNR